MRVVNKEYVADSRIVEKTLPRTSNVPESDQGFIYDCERNVQNAGKQKKVQFFFWSLPLTVLVHAENMQRMFLMNPQRKKSWKQGIRTDCSTGQDCFQ